MAEEFDETGGRIEFEIGAVRAVAHVIARGVRHVAGGVAQMSETLVKAGHRAAHITGTRR